MGVAGMISSLVLMLVATLSVARRSGCTRGERFWIAVGAGTIVTGATLTALSVARLVTPGAVLVTFGIVAVVALVGARVASPKGAPRVAAPRWTTLQRALFVALVAMMLLTGFEQLFLEVSNVDDRNYRASRAAYWVEHRSLLGWDAHNDRQVAFPTGGSVPFFLGILFTRDERAGLLLQWAAYPLVAAGAFHLLRAMRVNRTASLLGTGAICFTPIVLLHTRGVQPELWLTLHTLGCAYWAVRLLRRTRGTQAAAMAGIFAVLAMNVRMTALPLAIVVMLLPLARRRGRGIAFGAATAGIAATVVLCGLLSVLHFNVRQFGHPLGSATFRHIHAAETSATQVRAHLARAVVVMIEPPYLSDPSAGALGLSKLLHLLGGDVTLPREDRPWPGRFSPEVRRWAENYSLFGMLIPPALLFATWLAVRAGARRRMNGVAVVAILALPFFLGVVFLVRWMGVMGRFWIAPYALVVIAATVLLARVSGRHRRVGFMAGALVAVVAVPAAVHRVMLVGQVARPESSVALDEPYAEVLARTPPGATFLLVAGQGTRDYPLFRPRDGFVNRVVSWGRHAFDAGRMRRMLADERVTHVVVENDAAIDFEWDPPVATEAMVAALSSEGEFAEIPLPYSPHMRLFARKPAQLDRPADTR